MKMSPKKDEATATVSVRLGENMKKILEAIAYEERRTVSSLLGRLIDSYVGTYSPKNIARALQALRQREQEPSEVPIDVIMKEVERLQQPAASVPLIEDPKLSSTFSQIRAAPEPVRAPEGPRRDPVNPAQLYRAARPSVIKRKQKHDE
jgi:hypothetical protein